MILGPDPLSSRRLFRGGFGAAALLAGAALFVDGCSVGDPNELDPSASFEGGEGWTDDEGSGVGPQGEEPPPIPSDAGAIPPGTKPGTTPLEGGRAASPAPGKSVTYAFGVKNSRYAAGYHTGEDYAIPLGTNLVAVRDGVIRWSNDNGGAYGKWIGLEADNGRTYVYCHLSARGVAVGDKVAAGNVLAQSGATGNVTGPHLHFEDHPNGNFVYAQVRKPEW